MNQGTANHPIILFDGVCGLCDRAVTFVIDHDPGARFRFASLQSNVGRELLIQHRLDPDAMKTVVLIESGQAYTRSTAAMRIVRHLRFPFSLLWVFFLVPRPVRDRVYDWIARNRYRWFEKLEVCHLPAPEMAERFIT